MAEPTQTELEQLESLKTTWPKHWPSLDDLRSGNPEIAVLVLAGRLYQTEHDLIAISRIVAKIDKHAAAEVKRYFEKRDAQLQVTI